MTIGIYLLRCCHSKCTTGMASIRRRKRGLQVAIATILLLSFAPVLVLVVSRDPILSPFADHAESQAQSNVEVMQRQEVDDYHKPERLVYQNKEEEVVKLAEKIHIPPRPSVKQRKVGSPVLRDTLGNYEPANPGPERTGPGEYGKAVRLDPKETNRYEQSYKEYGFNMVISDRISLDRAIPDIRDTQCKNWHYPERLPNASVVVVFHNEGWTTLLRTIHSIINMTPPHLLHEVLMVDDYSDKEHLKERLDDYISDAKFQGKVRLIRNSKREGLIRSRTKGAKYSGGEVVVFLDAHCECGTNWLPPLLAEIAANRTTVVCPTVDAIEADDFSYGPQLDGLCRGAFDWDFWYKRIPVQQSREKIGMKYRSQAYRSPVMAGGLFAVDRNYFFELGGYDPGLQIWGGENFEISFKIWMCGGELKFVPCSRVGHIYRKGVPYSYPDTGIDGVSVVNMNYMRVAEVWLDEYRDYFYADKPNLRAKPCGDITEQVKFRRENCPMTFKWFMSEIAFDTLERFPPPSPNKIWGEIRALDSDLCIDTLSRENRGGPIGISHCHGMGGNQHFRLNMMGELAIYEYCLYPVSTEIRIRKCRKMQHVPSNAVWDYNEDNNTIRVKKTNHCLDHDSTNFEVFLSPCDYIKSSQRFRMNQPKS